MTDTNEGVAREARSGPRDAAVRDAEIETLAEFLAVADGSQWGAPSMRHFTLARALVGGGYRKRHSGSLESTEAKRDLEMESVFAALKKHHDQALRVGSVIFPAEPDMPEPVEIDLSEAYADSSIYEETVAALALRHSEDTQRSDSAATPCPACEGSGIVYGMGPDCCGNFAPDGSCRGHCCVPRETEEQCPDCNGQGVIPAATTDSEATPTGDACTGRNQLPAALAKAKPKIPTQPKEQSS